MYDLRVEIIQDLSQENTLELPSGTTLHHTAIRIECCLQYAHCLKPQSQNNVFILIHM